MQSETDFKLKYHNNSFNLKYVSGLMQLGVKMGRFHPSRAISDGKGEWLQGTHPRTAIV